MPQRKDDDAATQIDARTPSHAGAARAIRVTVLRGPDAQRVVQVEQRIAVVGRSSAADARLADPKVSSFHVELTTTDDGVRVTDLNSSNGTFHAGIRVLTAIVPSGTVLEVGDSAIQIDVDREFQPAALNTTSFGELRGATPVMRELFHTLSKLARTELSVLVEGPTGCGKELAARALHDNGPRAKGPFVVLDCAAIPATLAESILFGHEKGAFTGANDARPGVFENADGGTVFLDEIGELPIDLQPKLLRVLERRETVRVGGREVRPVRIRVVSATWRDLRAQINAGKFREDLYYRLAQARIAIPPLRDRADDVAMLVSHFLRTRAADAPGARAIAPDALSELCRRDYPGNVRELRSVVERAASMAEGSTITTSDLAFERMLSGESRRTVDAAHAPTMVPTQAPEAEDPTLTPFKEAKRGVIDEFERKYLERLLARSGNKLTRAAQMAGLERHTLRDLFRKHGLRGNES